MSRLWTVVLGLGAGLAAVWVLLWLFGPPAAPAAYMLVALTPIAALGALLVAVLALATRRWVIGGVAAVAVVILAVAIVPRGLGAGDLPPAAPGSPPFTVATANLQVGRADADAIVAMVRAQRVDALGLEELTPEAVARLDAAGLGTELPYTVFEPRDDGTGGTGLASRYPLSLPGLTLRPGVFPQVTARVTVGARPVDVVVVHPAAPLFSADRSAWGREIGELPDPAPPGAPARLIMGDFNATLDHRPIRELLDRGYTDAASAVGAGLAPTWPTDQPVPPLVTVDHVFYSGPVSPSAVTTVRIPVTDHKAVVARFGLAGPTGTAGVAG